MDHQWIQSLKKRLTLPLPGQEAQFLMAPSFRLSMTQTSISAKAGVLILLYPESSEWNIVFMKRPDYEGVHGGQISFPGGKFDPADSGLVQTALREAKEEIGINPESIEILGTLTPLYIPVSEYEVYPVVGIAAEKPQFVIDPYEVQYLIETPLSVLLDPQICKEKPYQSSRYTGTVPYFLVQGHEIWGATAMILSEFITIVKDVSGNQS